MPNTARKPKVELAPYNHAAGTSSHPQFRVPRSQPAIIEVHDSDSDIIAMSGPESSIQLDHIRETMHERKKIATKERLMKKEATSIPGRTKEFLKNRQELVSRQPSKIASVLFQCQVFLHTLSGKKEGTRVPMHTRGFQVHEVRIILFFMGILSVLIVTVDHGFRLR